MILKITTVLEADKLLPIFSNKDIVKYTNFRTFTALESLKEFLQKFTNLNKGEPIQFGSYSIYLGEALIGLCGMQQIDKAAGKTELWYILDKAYWGQGNAQKAVKLLLKKAAKNPEVKSVYAEAVSTNIASWKILEKNGFELVGETKDGFEKEEVRGDLRAYLLVK